MCATRPGPGVPRRGLCCRDGAEALCNPCEDAARHLAERDADAVLAALAKCGDTLGRGKIDELVIASDRLRAKGFDALASANRPPNRGFNLGRLLPRRYPHAKLDFVKFV